MEIERDSEGRFLISQPAYIDSIIKEAGLVDAKVSKFPLDTGYHKQEGKALPTNDEYRKMVGMLLYLTANTRPDISASIVALSLAESEYVALTETNKEVTWLKEVAKGFNIDSTEPTTILTDSQSCIAMIKNQRFSNRSKHIDTRFLYIRDQVKLKRIQLEYVQTDKNTADLMTKPLGTIKMRRHREAAGLIDQEEVNNQSLGGMLEYQLLIV